MTLERSRLFGGAAAAVDIDMTFYAIVDQAVPRSEIGALRITGQFAVIYTLAPSGQDNVDMQDTIVYARTNASISSWKTADAVSRN